MRKTPVFVFICLAVVVAASAVAAGGDVKRGEYLVKGIGMCGDCHTPHDKEGKPLADEWLAGSVIEFAPKVAMPWAAAAPPIAGLPGYTDQQAIKLLTTGVGTTGKPLLPPMPQYRLTEADARALVAYLRSLDEK